MGFNALSRHEMRQLMVYALLVATVVLGTLLPTHVFAEGLPLINHSAPSQDNVAAAVATQVFTKASEATPLASSAEPALKPNQPNHSSEAPIIVKVRLCGDMASRP